MVLVSLELGTIVLNCCLSFQEYGKRTPNGLRIRKAHCDSWISTIAKRPGFGDRYGVWKGTRWWREQIHRLGLVNVDGRLIYSCHSTLVLIASE